MRTDLKLNVLPIIAEFIAGHTPDPGKFDFGSYSKYYLRRWVAARFSHCVQGGSAEYADRWYTLAVDCMIAAGIGREQEQTQTVYCLCTGGED